MQSSDFHTIVLLAIALSLGLLIGVERGFKYRDQKEGSRIAGLRTYGLISLLGAVSAMIANQLGAFLLGGVLHWLGHRPNRLLRGQQYPRPSFVDVPDSILISLWLWRHGHDWLRNRSGFTRSDHHLVT